MIPTTRAILVLRIDRKQINISVLCYKHQHVNGEEYRSIWEWLWHLICMICLTACVDT